MENSSLSSDERIPSVAEMEASGGYCPVHEAITLLQEKWTLHIVRALLDGPLGFNCLGRTVGGCNPATLKARLDHLEEVGLVRRTVHSYMPPRTSYELAPAGVELQRVIEAIDTWARSNLPLSEREAVSAAS
jgi:DNA-binding HxlR family transcriptional regulator